MVQVTFGDLRCYDDLGLVLTTKEIGEAPIKTNEIEIEGADGSLDYTETFGAVYYGNRTLSFEFQSIIPFERQKEQYSIVQNALHGKKVRVVFDDDPDFYYYGRVAVQPYTNERTIGNISMEVNCEPYKYKVYRTKLTTAVTDSASITLNNLKMRSVPLITTTAEMTIAFNGMSVTHSAGTFIIPELELVQGSNVVTVTGTGSITFEWQEGEL